MENSAIETQVITLDQISVSQLPELQGWKEKQQQIVEDHPFIAIEDHKSYEEAKKHRTALVSARTDIQKQDKLIASKLKELRSEAGKVAADLIAITQPHEEKQQEEVKRYEAEREAKRLEEERIEKERKEAIQKSVVDFYNHWKKQISYANIDNLELTAKDVLKSIEEEGKKDYEEFELDFAEKCNLLRDQLEERTKYLKEQEEARKERERLAAEREAWEKEQAEAKAKAEKEEADRKAREEKERAAREAEEKRIREEREAEARELARQREELEAEKTRIAEEERKRQEAIEAERKAKEEAEAKAKAEAEEKARKEAEAKRLEELMPDIEKAAAVIKSLTIDYSPEVTIKDQAIDNLLADYVGEADLLMKKYLNKLTEVK